MDIKEKFLPIGTVVLLKGGSKELMITGYCIIPTGKTFEHGKEVQSVGKVFDYGACTYPEGVIFSDQVFGFNHEQIEKISHMGYETNQQKEFSNILKNTIEQIKEKSKLENQDNNTTEG